jgi:hypothetical protein
VVDDVWFTLLVLTAAFVFIAHVQFAVRGSAFGTAFGYAIGIRMALSKSIAHSVYL